MYKVVRELKNGNEIVILQTDCYMTADEVYFDESTIFYEYSDFDRSLPDSVISVKFYKDSKLEKKANIGNSREVVQYG